MLIFLACFSRLTSRPTSYFELDICIPSKHLDFRSQLSFTLSTLVVFPVVLLKEPQKYLSTGGTGLWGNFPGTKPMRLVSLKRRCDEDCLLVILFTHKEREVPVGQTQCVIRSNGVLLRLRLWLLVPLWFMTRLLAVCRELAVHVSDPFLSILSTSCLVRAAGNCFIG